MIGNPLVEAAYLVAAICFILSLMWMSHPSTSRRGVFVGEFGMLLAIVGTLLLKEVVDYKLIAAALLLGSAIGVPLAYMMPMTAIPQRTAISHSLGALAVALIGVVEMTKLAAAGAALSFASAALGFEMLLGFLTCTASVLAFAKLQELVPTRPMIFKGQQALNLVVFLAAVSCAVVLALHPQSGPLLIAFVALSALFGLMLVAPIGGADMPTVIALLNSYAGLAASAMGFALSNKLLIITGALDGASGFILAVIMCKAMNRSFANVMFGGFGQVVEGAGAGGEARPVRSASQEDAALMLENAASVVIVPGYGMAVAQAQHKVSELYQTLQNKGVDVRFAIHPVAGRMPGHMNVLLAEANIPYERLIEMDEINGDLPTTDVALIIGANDVVNPAARDDPKSAIAGMPIIEADRAKAVMVIKRSMKPGFAGIENDLYYLDKTHMLFGDAKDFVAGMVKELAGGSGMH
ncbi:MAG TPA: NAD(P)(+) transhydrogenase (Re/Si-specific) subunit beta [Phenylobacterium sp.]|uniref:NAD(P)(+) transhydrogenase (Re/Si-specific) subunit beta n=1 Tax=Phenylobacterium sp. TaxID=1871053 RepID=UPI002B47DFEF|nr:NAD(P)(+) transhydrogenase (Re/Si-specific) subunit beta [Phenylobacterium sp.]HKR87764.1 NAD(P)(+) transhydrogenase (Re/Si-specific) subunit beta [Phenylobacterium sp.]